MNNILGWKKRKIWRKKKNNSNRSLKKEKKQKTIFKPDLKKIKRILLK